MDTVTFMIGNFEHGTKGVINYNGGQTNFDIDGISNIGSVDVMVAHMDLKQYTEFVEDLVYTGKVTFGLDFQLENHKEII